MNKILKGEFYAVTSTSENGENEIESSSLIRIFKRAAVKKGFRLDRTGEWDGANVAEFAVHEDVPFTKMQEVMNEIAQATKLNIFLSRHEDLLGKQITTYPKEQAAAVVRKEAILVSAPNV